MEKFNKENANVIAEAVIKELTALGKSLGVTFSNGGGSFVEDKFTFKLTVTIPDEKGSGVRKMADQTISMANTEAASCGVRFVGNFIGSVWRKGENLFHIMDYYPKNRKYPFIAEHYGEKGRRKVSGNFFKGCTQVVMPTAKEFKLWLTTDIDDDRVSAKTEATYDEVNDYMSVCFGATHLFDAIDEVDEAGVAEEMSNDIYKMLFTDNKGAMDVIKFIKQTLKK